MSAQRPCVTGELDCIEGDRIVEVDSSFQDEVLSKPSELARRSHRNTRL
jgi:hypothetical protein